MMAIQRSHLWATALGGIMGVAVLVMPPLVVSHNMGSRMERLEQRLKNEDEKIVTTIRAIMEERDSSREARIVDTLATIHNIIEQARQRNIQLEARIFSAMITMCAPSRPPPAPEMIPPQKP